MLRDASAAEDVRAPRVSRAANSARSSRIFALLLALPALWVGYLMFGCAVDVPYGDQWDGIGPLFEKMSAGTLGFGDFFAFHNEHRIFFPRLLIFPVAKLTHWNVRAEAGLIWVLACLCALNLWRLAAVTGFRGRQSRIWLLLGAYVLLFTPMQWENLIWGFQIGFFLPLSAMTALPWAACALRRPLNFLVTAVLCLVSTFSVASGFTSWLLAAPVLMFCGKERKSRREFLSWAIWLMTAAASVVIYFHGYKGPDHHPNQLEALQMPVLLCQFIIAYLGNPFCKGTELNVHTVAQVSGAILLLLLVAAVVYLWRWRKDRSLIANSVPWISLAGITLFSAVLTMFGRIGYGVTGAIQSRYVSFAIMLPIALLFLGALIARHLRERDPARAEVLRLGYATVAAAFAAFFFLGNVRVLGTWPLFQHDRYTAKAVLAFRDILDEPEAIARYVHWNVPRARALADTIEAAGCLRPARLHSARLREIARATGGVTMGALEKVAQSAGGHGAVSGWAVLPMRQRSADSVILAYEKVPGDPIIFGRANVNGLRDDIAGKLGDENYRTCGWQFAWQPNDVPADVIRVTAWAFDADDSRAYEIGFFRP